MRGFATLCSELRATRKTSRKVALVADYLQRLDDESLQVAARFLTGGPFAARDQRTLSVGWATLFRIAVEMFPDLDPETLRECFRAVGDMGETFGLLQMRRGRDLAPSVLEVDRVLEQLAATRKPDEKARVLRELLPPLEPLVLKETVKLLVGGQRIGLSELLLEQAIARASDVPLDEVKRANLLCGDVGEVALRARRRELGSAHLALFHPLGFQLAATYEAGDELPWERVIVEEKLDGIRAQAHVEPASERGAARVALYSRSLDDITRAFPEIVERLARLPTPLILDGEILAYANGRALPFGQLQRRLGRKAVDAALAEEVPLVFVLYDVLAVDGTLVIDRPLAERRRLLEPLALPEGILLSPAHRASDAAALEKLFDLALANGNEGLMLKDESAPYTPGKRGRAWLKYKKARATLDVVVTAVEPGHGRRAGLLSDLTFAVRGPDGTLLNVGKAYSGLTDEEIAETTKLFRRLTERVYGGRVRAVRPEVVIEVAFDGIQRSARHKSGFALRFPRILRLRPDKPVAEIDTIERVAELYERLLRGETTGADSSPGSDSSPPASDPEPDVS
ncbi:MAG TPA: ATP-dependent DNA ligase [Candidatus Binatia bacterium]